MESYLEMSKGLARRWDAARPRTQQTTIGWSGMADCRAYLGFKLDGTWPTDEPDKARAIFGTALHSWWTHLRRAFCHDHGIPAAFDVPIRYGGVPGHIDEILWPTEDGGRWEVTDYKMPKLSSVRLWDDDDFLNEMFVQPHGYAAGVLADPHGDYASETLTAEGKAKEAWSGYDLDPDACVVRLLGMPVNGNMPDWVCHERPFDRQVPDDALARLEQVGQAQAEGEELPRDKPAFFCTDWCEFATACRGGEQPAELELITDPELAAAVNAYGLANEMVSANQKIKAEMRDLLDGARGRTEGGYRIWHGRGAPGKLETDDAAVEAVLGARGIPLTEVQRFTPPGKQKLYVKRS